jgi:hypothetical protein
MKILPEDTFPNQEGKYTCDKCGEKFRLRGTLDTHKKGHCPAEHLTIKDINRNI